MVKWIIKNSHQVRDLLHYFDDFITVGSHNSPLCAQYLGIVKQVCQTLGLPIHPFKCVGPSSVRVVLSTELAQIARFLTDTLEAAGQLVQQWRSRKWCNPRQLESLTSDLQQTAKVVAKPSCVGRYICCAAFVRKTTPSAWTYSFVSTLSGGTPSCLHGMVSVLGFFLACLLLLTSKSFQMHLGL